MSFTTTLREVLHAAFQSLWSHRMRTGLTTLGIVIGVASVITVVQLMKSLEGRIMADVNRSGSHTFFLSPWFPASVWKKGEKVRFQPITRDTITEVQEFVPEIRLASPEYRMRGLLMVGRNQRRVIVHAMDENGFELGGLDLAAGRGFTATDRMMRAPVMVVGANLAEDMDLTEASLGKTFTIGGQTAELIGILKKQGGVPFMPQNDDQAIWGTDNEVMIPFKSFKALERPWTLMNTTWRLQVDDRMSVQVAEDRMKVALRRIRGLRGEDLDNFLLETNRKEVEMVEKLTRTLLLASSAMVSISLLVGGIGVMNIMLVSVTERTREIGIRKALGARKRAILVQFLCEAVILCVAGGVFGVMLGLSVGTGMAHWLMKHIGGVPLWALVSSITVPALVGLIFGLYPANKAANMDPVEALRYE